MLPTVQTSAKHWSEYFFIGRIEVLLLACIFCNCFDKCWKALKQCSGAKALLQICCLSGAAFLVTVFVFAFVFAIFVFPI